MTTIFISRVLAPQSPFRQRLEAVGYRITDRSLIEFSAVPFGKLPEVDWIFFYSKRAVRYFFEALQERGEQLPSTVQLAAIGAGTADAVGRYGRTCTFAGSGEPAAVAEAFGQLARGRRVLFPQARHSRRSVQEYLVEAIVACDLIVYDNQPAAEAPEGEFDVLVFTSPLNAQAYFDRRTYVPGQRVVAIGPTTEAALRQLGIEAVETAANPSEEGLAAVVLGDR